jgi:hypothetical protein
VVVRIGGDAVRDTVGETVAIFDIVAVLAFLAQIGIILICDAVGGILVDANAVVVFVVARQTGLTVIAVLDEDRTAHIVVHMAFSFNQEITTGA